MDIENILYRIINGYYNIYVDHKLYKVILPTIDTKHSAHNLYLNVLDEHKYDISSWITDLGIKNLLNIYNIWNDSLEEKLNQLLKDLNYTKIELFKNFFNESIRDSIKKIIENLNIAINDLYNKKHYFDYLTLEHYAQNIKNQYLIVNMIYTENNEKVFCYDTFENIDSMFLEKILLEIHKNTIDMIGIKKLARHELWRSFWNISKENIFSSNIKDWTDEQRSLVNFSKVLDSIREHMESPSDDVINDDDALDGWILYQNDKQDKEKKKHQITEKFGLDKKRGDEVFVITQDKNERQAIYGLNDNQTNKDITNMIKLTKDKGSVNWSDLPHIQRNIKNELRLQGKIK